MNHLYLALFCLFVSFSSYAQQSIKLSYLNLKLTLPKDWRADGFGSKEWDEYGSSVCACAGVICDDGDYANGGLTMVIYPATKEQQNSASRQQVWDYVWKADSTEKTTSVKTKQFIFEQQKGSWDATEKQVFRYTASKGNTVYIVYIWSENKKQALNFFPAKLIHQLVEGIAPL